MVVIDSFTRWVNLYPLKEWKAEEAALALVRHIGQYGTPKTITSDADPVLLGKIVKQTLKIIGAKQIHTVAGSKQEQGIVERANKEVMRHIRNFIFDESVIKSYSIYIPLVQRIMNSSYHRSTGFSPAQLLYGGAVDLFRNTILEENLLQTKDISYNSWVQELKNMQLQVLAIAQRLLTKHETVHLTNYPSNTTFFEVGSFVLVEYDNPFRRGPSSKLLPFLKGPMRIVSKETTRSIYLLEDLVTFRQKRYHVKRLIQFNDDPSKYDTTKVALRDSGDIFYVERVSEMSGDPKGSKTQLFFKVHWVGQEQTTWEPWKSLRLNEFLHKFLKSHTNKIVQRLIPKNLEEIRNESDSEEENFIESE